MEDNLEDIATSKQIQSKVQDRMIGELFVEAAEDGPRHQKSDLSPFLSS